MGIVQLIILIIVVGVLVYLEETYLPVAAPFKTIIRWVAIICVILIVLGAFGVLDYLGSYQIPRLSGGHRG